VVNNKKKSTS